MFPSLIHRNFRLFLGGQLISLIGTWMQQLAMSWLVYRMTRSPFWLGLIAFCSQAPTLFLGLYAGVMVDRVNLHRLLMWTQALSSIQAFILAFLVLTGRVHLEHLVGLSLCLGVINAMDTPARQSFVIQMIEDSKKDLSNAIALSSSVMNGTRLIGPAIAGVVVSVFGEGVCFLLNAFSYFAVLLALGRMQVKTRSLPGGPNGNESILQSVLEGIRFAFGVKPIRILLVLLATLSLIGAPFVTLLPLMADQVFKGGAHTLGVLTTATGLGALFSSFWLASRKKINYRNFHFHRAIGACALIFAVALIGLSFSSRLEWALPILLVCGFAMLFQMAASNMTIQALVDDDKRGRVMSLFTLALLGISPFGSLFVGVVAERVGLFHTLLGCGSLYLVFGFWFIRKLKTQRLESRLFLDTEFPKD